jgi:Mrp family chromosome partitioning ATPase
MENIRQAVERARATHGAGVPIGTSQHAPASIVGSIQELDASHLESNRIIAYDPKDQRSTTYDVLRTQVLRFMDLNARKFLAVTSPTPACGKTVTAINLAMSISRQPDRSVLLVDMDIQKAQVSNYLGITFADGLLSVLEGRVPLASAVVRARAGKNELLVLPTEISTFGSSDWMTSQAMTRLFEQIRQDFPFQTVIVDLPPVLYGDDVIAILPQLDCVLLVAAIGTSTIGEIQECNKHLQSAEVVRLVLNKVTEPSANYYYY